MSDLNKENRQPDTEIPDRETILRRWDTWQKRIAADKDVSWARHEFELLLDGYEEEINEAAEVIMELFGHAHSGIAPHYSGSFDKAEQHPALVRARAFLRKHQRAE